MLRELGGQVWLTQLELAELYQTSKQNIGKHIQAIISEGELPEGAIGNQKFITAADGGAGASARWKQKGVIRERAPRFNWLP